MPVGVRHPVGAPHCPWRSPPPSLVAVRHPHCPWRSPPRGGSPLAAGSSGLFVPIRPVPSLFVLLCVQKYPLAALRCAVSWPRSLAAPRGPVPLPCAPPVPRCGRARCPHRAAAPPARCVALHPAPPSPHPVRPVSVSRCRAHRLCLLARAPLPCAPLVSPCPRPVAVSPCSRHSRRRAIGAVRGMASSTR